MYRCSLCRSGKFAFLPFLPFNINDNVEPTKTSTGVNSPEAPTETGWDRVKRMFQLEFSWLPKISVQTVLQALYFTTLCSVCNIFSEFDNVSAELHTVIQATCMSLFAGFVYGGTIESKKAYQHFMRTNEATTFTTAFEAKKKLQDAVTIGFGKGAFKWSWRLSLFCVSFVGLSTVIQVHRGKYGVVEYVAAGALTGFLYRFNLGPRGWIVGSALGILLCSVLGLFCGGATVGLLSLTGMSMEEARYWQYKWKNSRNEYMRKGMSEYLDKEELAIYKIHNDEVGEAGHSLDNLEKSERKHIIIEQK